MSHESRINNYATSYILSIFKGFHSHLPTHKTSAIAMSSSPFFSGRRCEFQIVIIGTHTGTWIIQEDCTYMLPSFKLPVLLHVFGQGRNRRPSRRRSKKREYNCSAEDWEIDRNLALSRISDSRQFDFYLLDSSRRKAISPTTKEAIKIVVNSISTWICWASN